MNLTMDRWILLIFLLFLFLAFFLYIRKALAIRKVLSMSVEDKLVRLEPIISPFGFEYKLSQDIFTSKLDAWQRECGYCSLYDRKAPFFHMIFDCEPVYFDYNGVTWLVELWKGQYGITTGCEIGIYKADRLIPERDRDRTLFQSVPDEEMPVISITLLKNALPVSRLCRKHWWLTSFCVGQYAEPESLAMKAALTFPSPEMCRAFLSGLLHAGYCYPSIYTNGEAVAFTFDVPCTEQPFLRRSRYHRWVQLKNRILLSLFLRITTPFRFTIDRLLLLYEYLPFMFRHVLKLKRIKRKRRPHYER